jgi:polysaccharide export outer membrane protein
MLRFDRLIFRALLALAPLAVPADAGAQVESDTARVAQHNLLRPGDLVRLRIWREPDLGGEFLVNEQGKVILPKIGELLVTDRSPEELRQVVLDAYLRFLRNPSIEIIFLRRINVLGAVRNPGLYPIDPTTTIADALALAGGAQPNGKPDQVKLLRAGEVVTALIGPEMRIAELDLRSGDQLYVPERSWWSRNTGILATVISSVVTIGLTIITINASKSN